MACAKPVVVTDIAGVAQDVVAQKAGIVVRPGSINELSEALARLFSDYAEMRRKGENALCLVKEKYTWRSHAEIITKVYSLKRKDYGD
jgi:glycosyltransferase involved in cell wall biosynthesis